MFEFDNSYYCLLDWMYIFMVVILVFDLDIFVLNGVFLLELDVILLEVDWVVVFFGNFMFEGVVFLVQVYGGYQFGYWNFGLGDGCVLLLGEVVILSGCFDI